MKVSMDNMSYEDAFERLENIIAEMESGQLSLDTALQKFEEAIKLSRICRSFLDKARQRVDLLLRDEEGHLSLEQALLGEDLPSD
ncbi:MAG: exodeoxyribonuclease VII small subunit [bacterium]|jgi:exodeoxyribonuclease VII small subunit|nr:exodeoxyribonuclease VII small subunit [bacterium]MDD3805500.1 exodeoxyribonuclease VII small subunit [bacterium]